MNGCSVIMVSYHTGPVLYASVKSVLRQQQLAELVIVNNGNPPDVLARLQQMTLTEPRLRIVSGGGNVGFARGCNFGVGEATGEFVLLLNPDCLLPPDALVDMMNGFNEIHGTMLAGCWLQNPDGSEQRGGRRELLTPETALAEATGLHRFVGMKRLNINDTPMPSNTHEVPAISGAFMCMRRADYQRLGGLDEHYFLHVEDLDLCMRVHRAGGKVICVPRVKVAHMLSTSAETSSRFIEWQKARGFMRYFAKHFRDESVPGVLLLADLGIIARFLLRVISGGFSRRVKTESVMSHSIPAKRLMVLASGLAELPERDEWYGRVVLVTGATSQVGLCVLRRLISSGASVLALSRNVEIPFRHERLRWIRGDLTDSTLSLQGYLLDMVVHCAPLWHLPQVVGLLADAEVKRIIAFGSTSIFGKALSRNAYEKDIVARLTQAEGELAERCREKNIEWTIFRPTLIYGVGLDVNVTSLAKVIDGFGFFPVYPPAFGRRQPVHADDLALAVLLATDSPAAYGKSYNISGGEILTYRSMLERIFEVCHKPVRIVTTTLLPFILDMAGLILRKRHINGEIARRMNDDLIFFHDDATRDFNYHPRPFLSGGIRDIEGY